ncbi:MAG: DEAD/DEAH RNA helicase [Candidatus Kaiserbacteria bacterium GW2011_GWB1_52_6]|uniref:DEAD/DEAH RNA helicase n=3 Tax=Candidatus Kaiseribacteriota TaxID=1752734 RepID=A0A0G2AE89_9BACT|nr:MAG: DEAD/DEAH RNA helicase [Candidatus Kaiserbacteria bacterium GW2011_GWA2_52_12]KKW28140.1 MAG: DEAD/DEAH RNA helicase [Candidatus Kaiserbacteria bacterium GW2011_GWB1_52_6]KKW30769.1 MAG: DEAD/DEAH RNA helicase [Candidatus Kaiserbacteria bacterium GW2011_GWC2_52_8b]
MNTRSHSRFGGARPIGSSGRPARSTSRRPSFGRRPSGGGRGFGRPQGRRPQGNCQQNIHFSKFINKGSIGQKLQVVEIKHAFADFDVDQRIKQNVAQKGYTTPTPIQDQAIPYILQGRDIVGIANTGTGKTGAFLIPLLNKVVNDRTQRVLIIVPTRELAVQIEEEYQGFSKGSGFKSVCAVGGMNINPQIRGMQSNPYFVIGTPGRLKDLMDRKALDLSKFRTVVLDEADRMLDMGFIADMRFILSHMPKARHTLCFSATLPPEIERLIGEFLHDAIRISVKTRDTAQDVEQDVIRIAAGKTKLDHLQALLVQPEFRKVLVFGRTKHGVEKLAKTLRTLGFSAESIHGNKTHANRQRALKLFKEEKVSILVATDVAARGLDIPKVSHVINYDVPNTYEDYVHRIGRTGRAGETGKALTFVE